MLCYKGLTSTASVASDFESTSATAIMRNNTKRGSVPNWKLHKMWNSTESYIKILSVIDGESIQYSFNGTIVCAMEMMWWWNPDSMLLQMCTGCGSVEGL